MTHRNTVFSQLLKFIPRHEFEQLANEHHKGRALRKTSRWSQFTALLLGQLSGRMSLRDIESNMDAQSQHLYHLGTKRIARSSLARLNKEQPASLYEALFNKLYSRCKGLAPKHGFRFKNPLYSLDASLIDLSLKIFPWSHYALGKGAMKLQLGLDHRGFIPAFATITESRVSDSSYAKILKLPKGSIVVFDRDYNDYSWYKTLSLQGVFFVTRQRSNAKYRVITRQPVNKSTHVTSDQMIRYTSDRSLKKQLPDFRRIGYVDPETKKHYVFITNHLNLSAQTIADIYKQRWQVELFFKWIKQSLKIKAFLGTTKNAVMTQIWIALCTVLILAFIKFSSKIKASMQTILRLFQLNLFIKRDLLCLLTGDATPLDSNPDQGVLVF